MPTSDERDSELRVVKSWDVGFNDETQSYDN
jgi:hypothetical protein